MRVKTCAWGTGNVAYDSPFLADNGLIGLLLGLPLSSNFQI
jgi:hypothetical protein